MFMLVLTMMYSEYAREKFPYKSDKKNNTIIEIYRYATSFTIYMKLASVYFLYNVSLYCQLLYYDCSMSFYSHVILLLTNFALKFKSIYSMLYQSHDD